MVPGNMLRGHPQRGIYRLMRTSTVLSAVNSAAVTVNMLARLLKRSVNNRSTCDLEA